MRGRLLAAGLGVLVGWTPIQAQDPMAPQEEGAILREASALEWRGRHHEAIQSLERLLQRKPDSAAGLFALERVLRAVDRVREVLPWADRLLQEQPQASGPRYLKLRVLVEIDSLAALGEAARAWFEAEPGSPDPYREVARLHRKTGDDARALDVLRRGMEVVGESGELGLEMGDLLVDTGRGAEAVEAWARALADPGLDPGQVVARARRAAAAGADLEPLLQVLLAPPADPARRLAGVRSVMGPGTVQGRVTVAERALDGLSGPQAEAFLAEVASDAATEGVPALEAWALGEISSRSDVADPGREARLAAAALAAGDTAGAVAAQTRLARSLPAGSVERRRVVADLIRVEAAVADPETLEMRLDGFRSEFPDAPEADELAARVAAALAARGRAGAALEVTGQVAGPRSQLERAWLLFAQGNLDEGRQALEAALPGLAPGRATEVIQLLAAMDRVGPGAATALARAAGLAHQGRPDEAQAALQSALEPAPLEDRPPLLHGAARLSLDRGDTLSATGHLRRLVDEHGDSPEAPEAMLWLAEIRARDPEGVDEARALLRRLILERPQAAVVPAARRQLDRLGRGG